MADENTIDNQSIAKLSLSNENVEAALMLLAETIVDHRNTMVTLAEENKKKEAPSGEVVKQPRNPLTALSRNLHGLVKELKQNNRGDLTNLMHSLNTNLNSMQSGIQSLINSNKELANIQLKKAQADEESRKKQEEISKKKAAEERLDKMNNRVSYDVNKSLRRNPWIRYMSPKMASRIQKFAGFADFTRQVGLPTSFGAGRLAASASAGSLLAMGGIGAIVGLVALAKTVIKRGAEDIAQAYKIEGLTGGTYTALQAERYRSSAGLLGLKGQEAFQKQREYYRYGVRDDDAVLQGVQSEKYYGISSAAPYFQRLYRSTDYAQKGAQTLGKAFANLAVIMKSTNMGMDELVQHQTSFMDAFNGQTTPFSHGQTTALLANFKDLINSYELSGSKLGDILSSGQRVDADTLTRRAYFAKMGGYQFRNSDLLSQAYELRRMGSGDLTSQLKAMQATIKGQMKMFGVEKFSQLSDQQKWMVTEHTLPMVGVDVSKMPSAEEFIAKLSRGTANLSLGGDLAQELKEAQSTDVEKVVRTISALENPLNSIKEFLFKTAFDKTKAAKFAEEQKTKEEEQRIRDQKGSEVNINIFDKAKVPYEIKATVPGGKAKVTTQEAR